MNKQMLLLKTMLASTSSINILRYSEDKKKRGLAIGNIIGLTIGYLMLGGIIAAMTYGMSYFGMPDTVPALPVLTIHNTLPPSRLPERVRVFEKRVLSHDILTRQ